MRSKNPLDSILPMRAPRTLACYVVREVLLYTLIGLVAIAIVLLTRNLVQALEGLVGAGFGASDLATLLRILGTLLTIHALPIAFLFGVMLAIGRMAADVEIVAMRACGVGLRTLVLPVLILGGLFSGLTWMFTLEAEPAARREMKSAIRNLLARGALIEPGKFNTLSGRLLYVDAKDADQRLHGIVISDRSQRAHPFLVFAETGSVALDEASHEFVLALENGSIHLEPELKDDADAEANEHEPADSSANDPYRRIEFDRFDYAIDISRFVGARKRIRAKEMTMQQLAEHAERASRGDHENMREAPPLYALHWHRRIASPLAPTLFGLVGVPLAMRRTRGARSLGVLWCAGLAFGYYLIQTFCEYLVEESILNPALAAWIPNGIFVVVALLLLHNARRGAS